MMIGFMSMGPRKLFTKEFFEKHFPNEKDAVRRFKEGYPDQGSGLFAHKLPLEQWAKWNNHTRAHYNFLEGIVPITVFLLVSGLMVPRVTAYLGYLYFVGRFLYAIGYIRHGPRGRGVGVLIVDLALLSLFILSFISIFQIMGGITGMMKGLLPDDPSTWATTAANLFK